MSYSKIRHLSEVNQRLEQLFLENKNNKYVLTEQNLTPQKFYRNCNKYGIYSYGCVDERPDEQNIIKKVQKCLGIQKQDGFFGTKTLDTLEKTHPNLEGVFKVSDLKTICGESSGETPSAAETPDSGQQSPSTQQPIADQPNPKDPNWNKKFPCLYIMDGINVMIKLENGDYVFRRDPIDVIHHADGTVDHPKNPAFKFWYCSHDSPTVWGYSEELNDVERLKSLKMGLAVPQSGETAGSGQ